jgi:V/A-type H+/Na+-transporting ATPase subunit E
MSLEKIVQRIEQDARNQAEEISKKALAVSDKIIEEAKNQAELVKTQALEKSKEEAELHKQRLISTANLDLRKDILTERQKIIDSAFQEAMDNLLKMKDEEYQKIIINMILPNVLTGNEEIVFSERDKARLGKDFLYKINQEINKAGKKGKLTIARGSYNILGGFVLRRGNIELNNSFESLFNSIREDLEAEVSKVLFP